MTPRVSVCLPTYNRIDFLPECVASIRAQSFGDFEVVAADNGSEDGTWEFLNDTAKADSRFRVFRNERQLGLVGNLNRVLAHARGEWIKFVLSDDFILPDCLRRLLAAADASGLPFAAARNRLVFEAGLGPEVRDAWATGSAGQDDFYSAQPRLDPEAWCGHILGRPTHNSLGAPTDTLIRRDLFHRRGGFNPYLLQLTDLECWHRLGAEAGVALVPEVLSAFRVHGASASSAIQREGGFRVTYAEPALIFHEFLRHPQHDRLRATARRNCGRHFLLRRGGELAWQARQEVRRLSAEEPARGAEAARLWAQLTAAHPRLRLLALVQGWLKETRRLPLGPRG
jgi:glycosyltransferase involved in cell wall biosynthesis